MKKQTAVGQSMVEFAITIPILLLVVLGTFELGRAIWVYASVTTAAREAGRYGSSVGDTDEEIPHYLDCAGIRALAEQFGAPGSVQDADVLINYDSGPQTAVRGPCPVSQASVQLGDRMVITVTGRFTPATYLPLLDIPEITFISEIHRTIIKGLILGSVPVPPP